MRRIIVEGSGSAAPDRVSIAEILNTVNNVVRSRRNRLVHEGQRQARLHLVDDGFYHPGVLKNPIRLFRYLRNLRARTTVDLDFYCSNITLKSNLRLNHLDGRPVSIKLTLDSDGNRNLWNEINAHKTLKRLFPDQSIVAEMHDYDRKHGNWIEEERIESALIQYGKIRKFVDTTMADFYARALYFEPLKSDSSGASGNPASAEIAELVDVLASRGKTMAHAFCNGDLSRSNLIKSRSGKIYICDWEMAGYGPVANDVAKLFIRYPHCQKPILKVLRELSAESSDCISAELQMAIAIDKLFPNRHHRKKMTWRRSRAFKRIPDLINRLLEASPEAAANSRRKPIEGRVRVP